MENVLAHLDHLEPHALAVVVMFAIKDKMLPRNEYLKNMK